MPWKTRHRCMRCGRWTLLPMHPLPSRPPARGRPPTATTSMRNSIDGSASSGRGGRTRGVPRGGPSLGCSGEFFRLCMQEERLGLKCVAISRQTRSERIVLHDFARFSSEKRVIPRLRTGHRGSMGPTLPASTTHFRPKRSSRPTFWPRIRYATACALRQEPPDAPGRLAATAGKSRYHG